MDERAQHLRRYPVGDYVYAHLSEGDLAAFRRLMRQADGHDESDDAYCSLGNNGVGVGVEPGEPIEPRHVRALLEHLSEARLLHTPTDEGDWCHLLSLATTSDEAAARLGRLFEVATGVSDEEAFDEDLRWDRIQEWTRQRDRLRALGHLGPYDDPQAPARLALVRWAAEGGPIPTVDDDGAQMDLDLKGR